MIVRNPYDQLASLFWGNMWGLSGSHGENFRKGINQFLLTNNIHPILKEFKRSLVHQPFDGDECLVDVFIQYERLEEAFGELGIKMLESRVQPTAFKTKPYAEYYNDNLIKLVEKNYAWELENFGYSFDGISGTRGAFIFPSELKSYPLLHSSSCQ
jgi:hypothetical protein